jgi:hypothetical protein
MASLSSPPPPPPTKTDPNKQRGCEVSLTAGLPHTACRRSCEFFESPLLLKAQKKPAERTLCIILRAQATPKGGASQAGEPIPPGPCQREAVGKGGGKTREVAGFGQGRGLHSSLTGAEHLGWSVWGSFSSLPWKEYKLVTQREKWKGNGVPCDLNFTTSPTVYLCKQDKTTQSHLSICLSVLSYLSVCLYCIAGTQPMVPLATPLALRKENEP